MFLEEVATALGEDLRRPGAYLLRRGLTSCTVASPNPSQRKKTRERIALTQKENEMQCEARQREIDRLRRRVAKVEAEVSGDPNAIKQAELAIMQAGD